MNINTFAAVIAATLGVSTLAANAQTIGYAATLSPAAVQTDDRFDLPPFIEVTQTRSYVSPSAPEAEHDASTVPLNQMMGRSNGPGAPRIGVSPSAPESEHNASTVPLDQMMRRSNGPGAPRIGLSPTATEAEQNATTVPRAETRRRPGIAPAPRSGVNPSAPD